MKKLLFALPIVSLAVVGVVYACGKITICHATGSESNPYVEITVADDGWFDGHIKHPNDIIPAPARGCPGPEPTATVPEKTKPANTPTETLAPTRDYTPPVEPSPIFTATNRPPEDTPEPTHVKSCQTCCVTQGEVKAIYGVVQQFVVGLEGVTKIEVNGTCATVYVNGVVKYTVNLSGWVIEYQ